MGSRRTLPVAPAIAAVVYDLAYLSASWLGKQVLFIDGTGMRMDADGQSGLDRHEPLLNGALDLAEIEKSITRVVGLRLFHMRFPSMRGALGLAPALRRMPEFLDRLRVTFDLVVIASPPASDVP